MQRKMTAFSAVILRVYKKNRSSIGVWICYKNVQDKTNRNAIDRLHLETECSLMNELDYRRRLIQPKPAAIPAARTATAAGPVSPIGACDWVCGISEAADI